MKNLSSFVPGLALLLCCLSVSVEAADLRAAYQQLETAKSASEQRKTETTQTISLEKAALRKELSRLQGEVAMLEKELEQQQQDLEEKQEKVRQLDAEQASDRELMTNLAAAVRVSAKQLQDLLIRSPQTALDPQRPEQLDRILDGEHFPGLDDMQVMADLFFSEMVASGQVMMPQASYTDSAGREQSGNLLLAGPFLAALASAEEPGLMRYDPQNRSFSIAGANLPWNMKRQLESYLRGESDRVPLDLSAGAALEQLVRQKGFWERIRGGGVLVWPILLLAVVAVLIGLERAWFLKRVHDNTDRTMNEVHNRAENGDWEGCQKLIAGRRSPVYNVVRAGLLARRESRETLESVLQEAILKELPRLERALPLLNIMGAVAPLLGLLGTVTGMIGTFEVINVYGTGDPRLLSGGISVALVTTMLGLCVAIPIMLLHTVLNRQVEHIVGDMEEKSVTLTNIIHRCCRGVEHEHAA